MTDKRRFDRVLEPKEAGAAFEMNARSLNASLAADGLPEENWQVMLDKAIDELNQTYFVVMLESGSVIARITEDSVLKRQRVTHLKPADIKLQYNHRQVRVGTDSHGNPIRKKLGSFWLEHPKRRTYEAAVLLPRGQCPPNVFNLWRGFGIEPKAGSWSIIYDHLLHVICAGDTANLDWLLGWMAFSVQYPERPAEVAVVLKGQKGLGKGMLARIMTNIFRHHAAHISNAKHLIGQFNSHLDDVLFLFLDEALWAGDKAGEGVLKTLITEWTRMSEPKGVNARPVPNRLKILMASNNDWVVPATAEERRFFVLEVSDCRRGDPAYFERLDAAIEGDELAAFFDHLQTRDLSTWKQRAAPHTEALNEQKLSSGDSLTKYWLDCLSLGCLIGTNHENEWPTTVPIGMLYNGYLDYAQSHGDHHPVTINQFGAKLRAWCPDRTLERFRPSSAEPGKGRPWHYVLKDLPVHRAAFLKAMNIDPARHRWDDGDEP